MGALAGPELVAAVSGAGGFGVLGVSAMEPDEIARRIARVRQLTEKPFGANIIIDEVGWATSDEDRAFVRSEVVAAITERVAVVVLFWGDAAPYVELARGTGVKVFIQVGSVEEAKAAAAAGVDAVIAQGVEAGGHVKGKTSIWALLPAAVEAINPLPVLAAGGIGNGAGLARALQM